jgi:hypothetical protein
VTTAAWGVDNTLSRALADRDPGQLVMAKALFGATATLLLPILFGEPLPSASDALVLFAIGATGYGLSLRFYLLRSGLLAWQAQARCSPSRPSSVLRSPSRWATVRPAG